MTSLTFKTNPAALKELLSDCEKGKLQLPDFQRGWVWDEDRIIGLIASIARAFPVGALMTLESGAGVGKKFAHRPIEGTPTSSADQSPTQLLLDGQQRMTSLYQSCLSRNPVKTTTAKGRFVERFFYIDIQKALANKDDLESAIFSVPGDRCIRTNFNRDIVLDLSTAEHEYQRMMYPINQALDWDTWYDGVGDFWRSVGRPDVVDCFKTFKNEILKNFVEYQIPVIALDASTSLEAVCLVFEKVNTGGKILDAFELLTAMYAAHSFRLRDDWLGSSVNGKDESGLQRALAIYGRMADREEGVLAQVSATDFLQAITLLHSKERRLDAEEAHPANKERWPAVRATRQTLLTLPLDAYKKYRDPVRHGFQQAAKFLRRLGIYQVVDLPYQAQLIPLAAIFADLGQKSEPAPAQQKIERWYWCGVFGELYGSATESRYAKDIMDVPAWVNGASEPDTVRVGTLAPSRLLRLYTRGSAAYKGINALLTREGAKDFRTGQSFDATVFFDENVDIHHIFPQAWCKTHKTREGKEIPKSRYDSIVNKTPLSYRTNRIVGGVAPSEYLAKLEHGSGRDPAIQRSDLDGFLATHGIPIEALRADDFDAFMEGRQRKLMDLVCRATGQPVPAEMASLVDESDDADQPVDLQFDGASDDRVHGAAPQGVL